MTQENLAHYQELRLKAEEKFTEISSRHRESFACKEGCHSCCKPDLTVNLLEKEALRQFLQVHPERIKKLRALEISKPHGKKRCLFLDERGSCVVYEARPIVCRTHGAPLQFREGNLKNDKEISVFRDVCPLNFKDEDISHLPPEDVINLDTVNTLLSLLQMRAFGKKEKRTRLQVDEILGE